MLRYLQEEDNNDYIKLIGQLTSIGKVSQSQFTEFVNNQTDKHRTIVYEFEGKIIGCLTYLIEQKIAHSYSCVMHIEDVVIDKEFRGRGLSRVLIDKAIEISKNTNCYKVILNCSKENVNFYKHLGFAQNEYQMVFRNH